MADAIIRRLVENATLLDAAKLAGRNPGKAHVLSAHIRKRRAYSTPDGQVYLPTRDGSTTNLLVSQSLPLLNLPEGVSRAVWGRTLDAPCFVHALGSPGPADSVHGGLGVPDLWLPRMRSLVLGNVFEIPAGVLGQGSEASGVRLGASAQLTVLMDETLRYADDAWIRFGVDLSTADMAQRIADFLTGASAKALEPLAGRPLNLIMHSGRTEGVADLLEREMPVCAAVFGFDVRLIDLANVPFQQARLTLVRHRAPYVVTLGPHDETMQGLVDIARNAQSHHVREDIVGASDLVAKLRQLFTLVNGLGPALTLTAVAPDEVEPETHRLAPIASSSSCLHDVHGRYYVRDEASDLWWTPDTAGHAGSAFKTFTKVNAHLVHEACRDVDGNVIDKFKGAVGSTVAIKDLSGCDHPESHVRRQ